MLSHPSSSHPGTGHQRSAPTAFSDPMGEPDKMTNSSADTSASGDTADNDALKTIETCADPMSWEPPTDISELELIEPAQPTDNSENKDQNQDGDPAEEGRRRREQRNAQARIAAVTAVRDDGRCIFLDRRVYDYIERLGWCEVSTEVLRSRIVEELASFMEIEPAGVTPRMTSDTTQAFRDTSQPPAAAIIERDDTGRAFTLQDGMPVLGVPWIDMIVHLTTQGEIMLTRRSADVWCPRAPVPLVWGDGTWVKPERTLAFIRRATTTFDDDPDSPEAHHRADLVLSGIGQTITESVDDHSLWMLFGAGGRGKGTLLRLCAILVGGSFSVQTPKDLSDRFALSSVWPVRMLDITESPEVDSKDRDWATGVARLKSISGGDKLKIEAKNHPARSRRLRCIVWVATNALPAWATGAHDVGAWMRRMKMIDFCGPEPNPPVLELEQRLIQADGAENIAKYAVAQYARVVRGELVEPPQIVELKRRILLEGIDPLSRWAAQRVTRTSRSSTPIDELTEDYRSWADDNDIDHSGIDKARVGQALKKAYPGVTLERKRVAPGLNRFTTRWKLQIVESVRGVRDYIPEPLCTRPRVHPALGEEPPAHPAQQGTVNGDGEAIPGEIYLPGVLEASEPPPGVNGCLF